MPHLLPALCLLLCALVKPSAAFAPAIPTRPHSRTSGRPPLVMAEEGEGLSLPSFLSPQSVLYGGACVVSLSGLAEKLPRLLTSPSGQLFDVALNVIVLGFASTSLAKSLGVVKAFDGPVVMGDEGMMRKKAYGTSAVPIQQPLRWNCDVKTAERICNYNRHGAEYSGYWERATTFLQEESQSTEEITFYDSNTGKPLFFGPRDRSWQNFVKESQVHGWPSFRDSEVNWDHVRVLPNGECISVDGTHLGHNLPDSSGNRYCINLVSVAGRPLE